MSMAKYEVPSYEEVRDLRTSVAKLEDELAEMKQQFRVLSQYVLGIEVTDDDEGEWEPM